MDFSHITTFVKSLIAVGIILLLLSVFMVFSNRLNIDNEEIAEGKALEYVKIDETDSRYPKIRFQDSRGDEYTFVDSTISAMSKQQRTFEVLYDATNPYNAVVYDKIALYGLPIITGMTGLGCLAFGFTVLRINRNKRKEAVRIG